MFNCIVIQFNYNFMYFNTVVFTNKNVMTASDAFTNVNTISLETKRETNGTFPM